MRLVLAVILATALAASAMADSLAPGLPPGRAAGIKPAQSVMTVSSVVLGGALLLAASLALESGGSTKLTPEVQNQSVAPLTTTL